MKNPLSEIKDFLKKREVEYKENVNLSKLSFVKIGGEVSLVVYPKCELEFKEALSVLQNLGVRFKVIGKMSNVLPPDGIYTTVLVKTEKMKNITLNGVNVSVDCGVSIPAVAAFYAEHGLSSFEELSGIPGSVGGAIYMNAGAYGKEIADLIRRVRVFDSEDQKLKNLERDELIFSYRNSIFRKKALYIISSEFVSVPSFKADILSKMSEFSKKRRESQPINLPSLGSVFKRVNGISAALLIDKCGLKGYTIGGASVSYKHAGFIINTAGAASEDYRALIEYVKEKVFLNFGVSLEEEIEYLS